MKAFDHFGGKCNGCGCYAEWCSCIIDDQGNLVETRGKKSSIPYVEEDLTYEPSPDSGYYEN